MTFKIIVQLCVTAYSNIQFEFMHGTTNYTHALSTLAKLVQPLPHNAYMSTIALSTHATSRR